LNSHNSLHCFHGPMKTYLQRISSCPKFTH
jgi:hypothetical protein